MKRIVIGLVVAAILFGLGYALGHANGVAGEQSKAKDTEIKQLREAFEQGQAVGTVRDVVVTEYVDRERVIYKTGATITKEIPVYVTPAADAACTLNRGFVRVHDAAAANVLPGSASAADAEPAGIALSAATGVIAENYTACNAVRSQLTALQKWVRGTHDAINNGKGKAGNE